MTEKRFTAIRMKNQISNEMNNYIQDNGTTILKLSFLEDCKDVCDVLNELNDENEQLKKDNNELENEIEKLESKLWNCQNVR